MTAGEGGRTATAREQVLLAGLIDWFGFERVHRHVAAENAGEPLPVPYLTLFDDEGAWWFACWLNLTDKGQPIAAAIKERNR
ncbi:hypothetical protein [Mycolicibacter minnesotensis]